MAVNGDADFEGELQSLVEALFPICRSITGDGVRQTLKLVSEWVPLEISEVPSGTPAFDWSVPEEWNVRDAYVADASGRRVVDFRESNLHLLNYSEPVDKVVSLDELKAHLFSDPQRPDWIPYRTSYYTRNWGFCVPHRVLEDLREGQYHVKIDADLKPGSLTYGECRIQGKEDAEVLLYTHVCHPSLANDNLSGIAVCAAIGRWLCEQTSLRYSYRLVFGPGTIGSIVWLSRNVSSLPKIAHGLVLGLLGDSAPLTYKRTRNGDRDIDRIVPYVVRNADPDSVILPFSPYGYDERQFGSPGIDLPVGRLTRSVNSGYPQYHSSADDMSFISSAQLAASFEVVMQILQAIEETRYFVNLSPHCEPQLGKRGLYRATGGTQIANRETALLWLLNQADGSRSLLGIAEQSGLPLANLEAVAEELVAAGLLEERLLGGRPV